MSPAVGKCWSNGQIQQMQHATDIVFSSFLGTGLNGICRRDVASSVLVKVGIGGDKD